LGGAEAEEGEEGEGEGGWPGRRWVLKVFDDGGLGKAGALGGRADVCWIRPRGAVPDRKRRYYH